MEQYKSGQKIKITFSRCPDLPVGSIHTLRAFCDKLIFGDEDWYLYENIENGDLRVEPLLIKKRNLPSWF